MKTTVAANVDDYLKNIPEKERTVLEKLRKTIRSVAPQAEEVISYQMPTFKYNGGLVSYAAWKNHCSLFPWSSSLVKNFSKELKHFDTDKGTIRFTVEKPLPVTLVKKIIKARMKENEERALAKKIKKVNPNKIKI